MVKVNVIHRDPADFVQQRPGQLQRTIISKNPLLHPFQREREYTRALTAVKLQKLFAKPLVFCLEGHRDSIKCLTRSRTRVASFWTGSCNGEVAEWNLAAPRRCVKVFAAHDGFVRGMTISPKDQVLLTGGDDRKIKAWRQQHAIAAAASSSFSSSSSLSHLDVAFLEGETCAGPWGLAQTRSTRLFKNSSGYRDNNRRRTKPAPIIGLCERGRDKRLATPLPCGNEAEEEVEEEEEEEENEEEEEERVKETEEEDDYLLQMMWQHDDGDGGGSGGGGPMPPVITTARPVQVFTASSPVTSLDYHTNQPLFVSAGERIDVWDQHRASPLHSFSWDCDIVHAVRFNLAENRCNAVCWNPMQPTRFIAACEDQQLYSFDMRRLHTPLLVHKDFVNAVVDVDISPTGVEFAAASFDGTLRLFKCDEGRSRDVYHTKRMQSVLCCKYTADSRFVLTGSADMTLRVWKSDAAASLCPRNAREMQATAYRRKLVETYAHLKEIKRIARHHHVPKLIHKKQETKRISQNAKKRREENLRRHRRPGSVPVVPEKKKAVYKEIE